MPCQNDVIYINTFQLPVLVVRQPTQNVLYIHQLCVCVCVCVYMCSRVHVRVCDDNYMYKNWMAGPNTN